MIETIEIIFKIIASIAVLIGLFQLYEVRKKRLVDMYWKISDNYHSEDIDEARKALFKIEGAFPGIAKEGFNVKVIDHYKTTFHDAKSKSNNKVVDRKARKNIRFLSQIGALVKKGMIDKDMVFDLIGAGLEIDHPTLEIVVAAHRKAHQNQKMYEHFEYIWSEYRKWKVS